MNEPVEYQYRTRPDWIPEWNGWNTCSKDSAEAYEKTPYLHDWHYEVRRLYTSPPAQQEPGRNHWEDGDVFERIAASKKQPAQRKPLTDEEIEAMWPLRPTDSVIQFARAIEAKLKEKNT